MKTLIVYYSKTGRTKKVAQDLAGKLGADLEELIDQKKRTGLIGYLTGGRDAMKKNSTIISPVSKNPADYDLIILGMPVWAWNLVPAMRAYLLSYKTQIKRYAFFVTSDNTASSKILPYFVEVLGFEPIAHIGFNNKELKNTDLYQKNINNFIVTS